MPLGESGYRGESKTTQSPTLRRLDSAELGATPLVWWLRIVGASYLIVFVIVARGYEPAGFIAWILIHAGIIMTGYVPLRTDDQMPTKP